MCSRFAVFSSSAEALTSVRRGAVCRSPFSPRLSHHRKEVLCTARMPLYVSIPSHWFYPVGSSTSSRLWLCVFNVCCALEFLTLSIAPRFLGFYLCFSHLCAQYRYYYPRRGSGLSSVAMSHSAGGSPIPQSCWCRTQTIVRFVDSALLGTCLV